MTEHDFAVPNNFGFEKGPSGMDITWFLHKTITRKILQEICPWKKFEIPKSM